MSSIIVVNVFIPCYALPMPKVQQPQEVEGFSSLEVSNLSGVSLRQLQWWDEKGLLKPASKTGGFGRVYTEQDAMDVVLFGELRQRRFPLKLIKRIACSVKWSDDFLLVATDGTMHSGSDTLALFYLMTSFKKLTFAVVNLKAIRNRVLFK